MASNLPDSRGARAAHRRRGRPDAAIDIDIDIAVVTVDRRGPDAVNLVCMLGVIASTVVLAFGSLGGALGLTALALGSLLLDVGMQSGMVANQVRIYGLRPRARSRLNTAYMTCAYLGGGVGSWLGVHAYTLLGWLGVCILAASLTGLALARHLTVRAGAGDADCGSGASPSEVGRAAGGLATGVAELNPRASIVDSAMLAGCRPSA